MIMHSELEKISRMPIVVINTDPVELVMEYLQTSTVDFTEIDVEAVDPEAFAESLDFAGHTHMLEGTWADLAWSLNIQDESDGDKVSLSFSVELEGYVFSGYSVLSMNNYVLSSDKLCNIAGELYVDTPESKYSHLIISDEPTQVKLAAINFDSMSDLHSVVKHYVKQYFITLTLRQTSKLDKKLLH